MALVELAQRLEARREEIEQTLLARVYAVEDPGRVEDPEYVLGLREAVGAALDYGLAAIRGGEDRLAPVPDQLLAQARRAACSGVGLDTLLRRYVAGHTLLGDFIVQEAQGVGLAGREIAQRALRAEAARLDRVIEAIASEYHTELEARSQSHLERRAEAIRGLLSGELAETARLDYDLTVWHLGAIACGVGAERALRGLAKGFDRQLLMVPGAEGSLWAWFAGTRPPDPEKLAELAERELPAQIRISLGEPGRGLAGWRLTHRQAAAALTVAQRSPGTVTRYADVCLLASMLQDEMLARSFRRFYLAPLAEERGGGVSLRQTLRAYFATERNVASTAAILNVTRQTVTNRLRTIEDRLCRPLSTCALELELALRMEEMTRPH